MKTTTVLRTLLRLALRVMLPLSCLLAHAAPTVTQPVTLNPGWNALHLSVQPADPTLGAVFAGLDVDSVWTYDSRLGAPEFVQEVTEQALSRAGWFSWVPTNQVDAFQNTLFQVQANRAYLVKLNGTTPVSFNIAGRPSARAQAWLPGSFNLRGLPVDPAIPPTFLAFFRPSSAHYSTAAGLTPIYRLNASGAWQRVAPTDLVQSGEAYWIQCRGGSDYIAPFVAAPTVDDGLDFGAGADDLELNLRSLGTAAVNVTVRDLGAPAANPISYADRRPDLSLLWPALPSPWVVAVPAGQTRSERFGVRRADMTEDLFETVLEITDGLGTRHLLPVTASRVRIAAVLAAASPAPGASLAGLWVGQALVNAVSEAHSGPLTTNISAGFTIQLETNAVSRIVTTNRVPNSVVRSSVSMATTPTAGDYSLRLLLHVDAVGQTRLLKEVIEMWQDGVSTNDADGNTITVRPGRFVLLTDDSLVGRFTGVSARDGVPVGRRLSTAGFDFADNELLLAGDFAIGSSVTGTNTMSDTFARNPFKHRYHPAHQTGYDIRRVIQLDFSAAPTNAPPGYGERVLDGVYHETVTGLHRTNIVAGGTFRLTRIATTAVLNQ